MDKINVLNDVCVFCYKSVLETYKPGTSERCQNVVAFFKFLGRLCGKKLNVSNSSPVLATCSACVTIIDSCSELYHQVECLQLQMEWRLDKLKNVMTCADKIPSRRKQFRKRYSISDEQQRNDECVDGKEWEQLLDIRNTIQLHVGEYLSNVFPRVRLETVRKSGECDASLEMELNRSKLQDAGVPFNVDPLLEWIKTVIAVTMCCFPIFEYHHKASPPTSVKMQNWPQIICESDTVSEPFAAFNDNTLTSPDATDEKQSLDQMMSLSSPTPDNIEDAVPNLPVPSFPKVDTDLEEDTEKIKTPTNHVQFEQKLPNTVYQSIETNAENRQNEICANLIVGDNAEDALKFENSNTSSSRQLRSKFRCTRCYLTFSTESRLNEHSQSCTNGNVTEDDEEDAAICKKDSGSEISSQGSATELSMEEDSDSNESIEDSNIEPNADNKVIKTVSETSVSRSTQNLTVAEVHYQIKSIVDDLNATIPCPEESCTRKYFTQEDLVTHSKQHGAFQCNFCPVEKTFAPDLALHELQHADSNSTSKYKCSRCDYSTNLKCLYLQHHLRKHLHMSPDTFTVTCRICLQNIKTTVLTNIKITLTRHYLRHHHTPGLSDPANHQKIKHESNQTQRGSVVISDDGVTIDDLLDESNAKWPCPVATCKLKFFTEYDLASHAKLHGNFNCKFCPVVKKFAPDLAYHEIREHKKKNKLPNQVKCSRCEFSTDNVKWCVAHYIEVHLNLPPATATISCPICQHTFKGMVYHTLSGSQWLRKKMIISSLLGHFVSHHDKSKKVAQTGIFNCEHCPAYFIVQNQLLIHSQRMHPEQTSLSCVDCCKQFRDRCRLIYHRTAVHHNNDESGYEFVCQVPNCSRRYEYECDLQRHTASHSIYSSNTCPECGKVILNKSGFDMHVKSHQGHVCEQCGKKFRHKANLTIHMLYHAGPDNWQFMCDICSVKCPTKDKLKEHKKIHSKTKPYICETCGATYAQRHNWRHHMIKKHGVADFTRKHTKTKNFATRKGTKQQVPSKRV